VRQPFAGPEGAVEYMHKGAMKIRFWNVTSRIVSGRKSVGVVRESLSAEPGGGEDCGMKNGTPGVGMLVGGAIVCITGNR
jgi:hypothetical protein